MTRILNQTLPAMLAIGLILGATTAATAQRGVEFMNSPGYQRALIESRKQRLEAGQAATNAKPEEKAPPARKRRPHRR